MQAQDFRFLSDMTKIELLLRYRSLEPTVAFVSKMAQVEKRFKLRLRASNRQYCTKSDWWSSPNNDLIISTIFLRIPPYTNKVPQYIGAATLKQYIVQKPFQQEHLQAQIARIEAAEPSLPLFQ
jgi:hypothetical protein